MTLQQLLQQKIMFAESACALAEIESDKNIVSFNRGMLAALIELQNDVENVMTDPEITDEIEKLNCKGFYHA